MNPLFPFLLSGRISRATFFKLALLAVAPWLAIAIFNDLTVLARGETNIAALPRNWVIGLFAATAWIMIAAIVRRFHDRGRSLFWLIIPLAYATWFAWDFILASEAARGSTPVLLRKLSPDEIRSAIDTFKWTAIAWLTGFAFLAAPALWMLIDLFVRRGERGSNKYGPELH